jgi:Mrp family chromosome partitioning ATPase
VCDATILVLRADKSTKKSAEHARNALMAIGANMIGAIVNDASNKKGYEVYGGSYYGNPDRAYSPETSISRRLTAPVPDDDDQEHDDDGDDHRHRDIA